MPTKKTVRRKRAPSKGATNVVALQPRPKLKLEPPISKGLLLELAMAYYGDAQQSVDPRDIAIARVLDAAWLMHRRRERDVADPECDALDRAAAKYLATRGDTERWAHAALPPGAYERAGRIKKLALRAAEGFAFVQSRPEHKRPGIAQVVAATLLAKVEELGLAADRVDRSDPVIARKHSEPNAWTKLLDALQTPRVRADQVAALALQCRGVPRLIANAWTRAAL